ncbi:MAG TPA: HAD-IC family P-type ATPase [Thermomicrobiales bacterium]|jgi:cation-transporting ATPase E
MAMVLMEALQSRTAEPTGQGLTEAEVRARRARGEGNDVEPPTSRTYWQIVRANLFTVINSILVGLGAALLIMGRVSDAIITAGIVVINAVINTVQEVRAKRQLDRIALLVHPQVTVMRDGERVTVHPREIVRGDLLIAQPGDQIVADGRIIGAGRLEVDEALLTGEAEPITKAADDTVHSGSFCVSGSAQYLAERVGAASLINGLTASARTFRQVRTPLQREIDLLMRLLVVIVAFIGLLFALVTQFNHTPLTEGLQIAAVLAGLIPNGLIFMVTIAYAIGALRLAESDLLIQQTNAIESFSNVDILCLDKTGTLTANRLELHALAPLALEEQPFRELLGAYTASVSAHNPTSTAIAAALDGQTRAVCGEIPFNAARKWGALTLADGTYALGAPDILFPSADLPSEPLRSWIGQGLRVLLLARFPDGLPSQSGATLPRLPAKVIPLGLIALREELRPEAPATLHELANAGVAVKVISGDHPTAVAALARQVGLGKDLRVVSGTELDALTAEQFAQVASEGTIFGRITPQQKARLITALRSRGHYVAMIGDGVNDVLSLKEAQVGIAMQSGSAAARAVADIVLLRDSFAAVPRAFAEGQRIVTGLRDCLALYLVRLAYMILAILAIGLIVGSFPFSPKNTALISFLTLGLPTYAFVAWGQTGVQRRRGVIGGLIPFIVSGGLMMTLLILASFVVVYAAVLDWQPPGPHSALLAAHADDAARSALTTAAVLGGATLIAAMHLPFHSWGVPTTMRARLRPTFLAVGIVGLYTLILAVPTLRTFFELVLLPPSAYAALVGAVAFWAFGLWLLWRTRLTERLLGLAG